MTKLYEEKKSVQKKYFFFYNGPFSQWYSSKFTSGGVEYVCCEQYMMAQKAVIFNDMERYDMIMESIKPWDHKMHGRMVKGYNDQLWNASKNNIVTSANELKFSQNEDLKKMLLKTNDKILVEASPTDRIWGIGIGIDDPNRFDENKWRGQNLLGKCLMVVRDKLRE
jgi:hypothetical protein